MNYLLYQWSKGRVADYQWIFLIPIRNLTKERYQEAESYQYSVADVLIKECFPTCRSIRQIQGQAWDLWKDILNALVTGDAVPGYFSEVELAELRGNVLIILDGYDEKYVIPGHLQPIFYALLSAPYVLVTSRNYQLDDIELRVKNNKIKYLELVGFSDSSIQKYIEGLAKFKNERDFIRR